MGAEMTRIVAAALAAFVWLTQPAAADPKAVQSVITQQLSAFRAGDADAAYALAAPSIKRMFKTPERFITMVRKGYAPVYYNRSPVFLRSRAIDSTSYAQEVGLVDRKGQSWTALYTLAQQPDGSWRITGCYLRKTDETAA